MSDPIWLSNLSETTTGTDVSGKQCLDVFVADGNITFTEEATAADGAALPAVVKVVAGYDGAAVQVIKTDAAGELQIDVLSSALPAGAATEAKQDVGNTSLSSIDGKITSTLGSIQVIQPDRTSTGSITAAQSVSIVVNGISSVGFDVSGTWTGTITIEASVDGVTFYTAQAAALTGGLIFSNLSSNNVGQMNVSGFVAMRLRGNTVTSGTATITIRGNATTGPIILSEPLPNGGNTIGLVGQSGTWTVGTSGFVKANTPARNVYSSVNVTTAAYVQLVASTTTATKEIEIFDSSGQTMMLATGAAAAEVDQMLIFPGGNGRVKLAIAAATRVSIKAVSATASVGEIDINFYG